MRKLHRILLVAALMAPAAPALAHPGHGSGGFAAGILHPLTGTDHMVAMLMVGVWAGLVAGRAMWVLPTSFLAAMLAGFAYGELAHTGAAGVEMVIILSLIALGTAVALKLRAPLALAAGAAGLFGFAHGMAHGLESPGGQASLGFAGGFLVATAALHGAGLLLARHMPVTWARAIGVAGAGLGLLLAGAG
ncbi:MAG TPA: HupE/UreJ family protein [Sphingobium sp.]